MVSGKAKNCIILKEFSPSEQHRFFGIKAKKALHHIDTLYYAVHLNEPPDLMKRQREGEMPAGIVKFLGDLKDAKAALAGGGGAPPAFGDLIATYKCFSIYEYCVSLPECFDVFISSYLPNPDTPRIVVQLRSRYLVLEGVKSATEASLRYLRELLATYGLLPVDLRENRIDYAFHTNIIQNPDKFFDDNKLRLHLKTNLRKFSKYGDTREFRLDTLNLGRRTSNNVFFRAYNKGREVVEMNYKAFFIERWYSEGLISEFDKYVYETAYRIKAYRSGLLLGRLKWYLEFGRSDSLKALCQSLIRTDFVNSDNFDDIEQRIDGIIPEPTIIFNVEYQVKRKFFTTCEEWLGLKTDLCHVFKTDMISALPESVAFPLSCDPLLVRLFGILFSGPQIIDYLTGFCGAVSFISDRSVSYKTFKEQGEPYMYWWRRLRAAKVDYGLSTIVDLYRGYDRNMSIDRSIRLFQGNLVRLSLMKSGNITEERAFVEDMADALCLLNDNDIYKLSVSPTSFIEDSNGERSLTLYDPKGYGELRKRKARQLKGIISNNIPPPERGEKEG